MHTFSEIRRYIFFYEICDLITISWAAVLFLAAIHLSGCVISNSIGYSASNFPLKFGEKIKAFCQVIFCEISVRKSSFSKEATILSKKKAF